MGYKFTDLGEIGTVANNDILPIVDVSAGTSGSKKITVGNLLDALNATGISTTSNLSSHLLHGSAIVATAVDTGTGEITVPFTHSLCTGMPVYVAVTAGTAIADTIYWVVRSPTVYDKIKLATTYENAIAGTTMTLAPGTTPRMVVHRDPTGRIVDTTGLKKNGSEGGIIKGPITGPVSPSNFGASVTSTNNSLAIQMSLHWVRTSYNSASSFYTATGTGYGVVYRHTAPLQAGEIRNPGFRFVDLFLNSATNGEIALDCSGMNTGTMRGLSIEGDLTLPPSVGLFISRVHSVTAGPIFRSPVPSASDNDFTYSRFAGYFTKASLLAVNADLTLYTGSKSENRHRNPAAVGVMLVASQEAVVRQLGAAVSSFFWPVPDATWVPSDIGTITHLDLSSFNTRRPFNYSLKPTNFNTTATPIILTFDPSALTGESIVNGERVSISIVNNGFTFQEGEYQLKGISGDTAELWTSDGSAQVSHLTAGVGGVPVAGVYVTARVTNMQGPPLYVAGPAERVEWKGYVLGYSPSSIIIDLTDGGMDGLRLAAHAESGKQRTFDIIPAPATPRVLGNADLSVSGDLTAKAHVWLRSGSTVTIDGRITVEGPQSGTPSLVLNQAARLFNGTLSNLTVFGYVRTTLTNLLSNWTSLSKFRCEVYDAETATRTFYPWGDYTPTLTGTNIDSATATGTWMYWVEGNKVTVVGVASIDPTGAGAVTINIPLPVASNLSTVSLRGQAIRQNHNTEQGTITADAAADVAVLSYTAVTTTSYNMNVQFTYRLA